jgi:hypothetical protein
MMFADPATEDHADFVGLFDRSIDIEQSLAEVVQCCTTTENKVVAELDLREERFASRRVGLLERGCASPFPSEPQGLSCVTSVRASGARGQAAHGAWRAARMPSVINFPPNSERIADVQRRSTGTTLGFASAAIIEVLLEHLIASKMISLNDANAVLEKARERIRSMGNVSVEGAVQVVEEVRAQLSRITGPP